jgi:signal transduction histidine kinase
LLVAGLAETLLRTDLGSRPIAALLGIGPMLALFWRRTNPLQVLTIGFAAHGFADVATLHGSGEYMLWITAALVILPYALFRWGSGRECALGVVVMALVHIPSRASAIQNLVEAVAAAVFLLLPAATGLAVRFRAVSKLRERDQVKMLERELLARELHDSVAHHISAIIVQAQAGRAVAAAHPAQAAQVLEVIETEAARTLAEMRALVGALRQGEAAEFAPQRGVVDIPALAEAAGQLPRVRVSLSGRLDDLSPIVDTALYRLAQEAITNCRRHARHATCVDVGVTADDKYIKLTVIDDGDLVPSSTSGSSGYGLIGMTERAVLLGGTFHAGPGPRRGWQISATLPRQANPLWTTRGQR